VYVVIGYRRFGEPCYLYHGGPCSLHLEDLGVDGTIVWKSITPIIIIASGQLHAPAACFAAITLCVDRRLGGLQSSGLRAGLLGFRGSSKVLRNVGILPRRHYPEDFDFNLHCRENMNPCIPEFVEQLRQKETRYSRFHHTVN